MNYSDKLNYLFELTQAEGKELAQAMSLTPPQISKMRRGQRGLPKSPDSAWTLALFFARRCRSEQQLEDLAAALRIAQLRQLETEEDLARILLDWLGDERDPDEYAAVRAQDFLRHFSSLYSAATGAVPGSISRQLSSGPSAFLAYYGSGGKRLAVQSFLNHLLQRRQPCTIDVLSDESPAWITEDPGFSQALHSTMARLTEQGCFFRRIAGPIMDMDEAFQSLDRWFPLYLTGKATSYYFKRMRDPLNRLTLMAAPGAALFSFSVGLTPSPGAVTFFTVEPRAVSSLATEFENYLDRCEPLMQVYNSGAGDPRLHECILDYESCPCDCLQRSDSLSFITLPWEVALSLRTVRPQDKEALLTNFAQRYKKFRANLERCEFVDIIRLAPPREVLAGKTPIPASLLLGDSPQYYTATGYVQHLLNVVYLLEHESHYRVVLREPADDDATVIYVKEGFCAILACDTAPFAMFRVAERYLVEAFTELLRRQLPPAAEDESYRRQTAARLRELIAQLQTGLLAK